MMTNLLRRFQLWLRRVSANTFMRLLTMATWTLIGYCVIKRAVVRQIPYAIAAAVILSVMALISMCAGGFYR